MSTRIDHCAFQKEKKTIMYVIRVYGWFRIQATLNTNHYAPSNKAWAPNPEGEL
jgi:hypothetical protein